MKTALGLFVAAAVLLAESSDALVAPQPRVLLRHGERTCGKARLHAIKPLNKDVFDKLSPQSVSKEQWLHFWGNNEISRASRIFEISLVSFFGLWVTWFLTFIVGTTVGTFMCFFFLFWGIIAPYTAGARRNADFRFGILDSFLLWHPKRSLHVALFTGKITRCERVVADFKGRRFMLKLDVEDEDGRIMKVRAPLLEAHSRVKEGQQTFALLVSEDPNFVTLERASDVFIPAVPTWAGEYPFVRWERLPLTRKPKVEAERTEAPRLEPLPEEPRTDDAVPGSALQQS